MNAATVAIITRTKNRNLLLDRAIGSVLSQTYADWLHVIVNDGGDKTALESLLDRYQEAYRGRLLVLHNPRSLGMEAASNRGIAASDSTYLVIHDDDDSWRPQFLEKAVAYLAARPAPSIRGVIAHTDRIIEEITGEQVLVRKEEAFNHYLRSVTLYRCAAENSFPPISFLFERAVLAEIGPYREDLPVLGDWDFNLRFLSRYDVGLIPEPLARYHHRVQGGPSHYSNSVVGGDDKHKFYDCLLRNEYLRRDMDSGKPGLGFLVNVSRSFESVHWQLLPLENLLKRLKANRLVRLFYRLVKGKPAG